MQIFFKGRKRPGGREVEVEYEPPKEEIFTGWTNDDSDPASVDSNGGSLTLSGGATLQADSVSSAGSVYASENVYLMTNSGRIYFPTLEVGILAGGVDPTSGSGVEAGIGSLYLRSVGSGGDVFPFVKTGAGNTDWHKIAAA